VNIKELSGRILDEYNKVHDKVTGEFSSGSSGSSQGEIDFNSNLSSKEILEINATVEMLKDKNNVSSNEFWAKNQAKIDQHFEDIEKSRTQLVHDMVSPKESKMIEGWALGWCKDPDGFESIQQIVIKNKLMKLPDNNGMTEKQLVAFNKIKKDTPESLDITPEQLKAGAIFAHFNQETIRQNYPDGVVVYRGIHSEYAGEIKNLADTTQDNIVGISTNSLSSFTTMSQEAVLFADGFYTKPTTNDKVILKTTLKPDNVWDSHYTSRILRSESEVVAIDGKENILNVKMARYTGDIGKPAPIVTGFGWSIGKSGEHIFTNDKGKELAGDKALKASQTSVNKLAKSGVGYETINKAYEVQNAVWKSMQSKK